MEKSEIWVFFKPTNFLIANKAWSCFSIEQGCKESLKQTFFSFLLPKAVIWESTMQMSKAENACPETNGQRRPWKIFIFCWLKGERWRVSDWNKSSCTESCKIGFERSSRNERGSGQETCPKQLKAMLELWASHGIGHTQKNQLEPRTDLSLCFCQRPILQWFLISLTPWQAAPNLWQRLQCFWSHHYFVLFCFVSLASQMV